MPRNGADEESSQHTSGVCRWSRTGRSIASRRKSRSSGRCCRTATRSSAPIPVRLVALWRRESRDIGADRLRTQHDVADVNGSHHGGQTPACSRLGPRTFAIAPSTPLLAYSTAEPYLSPVRPNSRRRPRCRSVSHCIAGARRSSSRKASASRSRDSGGRACTRFAPARSARSAVTAG